GEWLLTQQPARVGSGWNNEKFWGDGKLKVAPPSAATLKSLARVYLTRLLPKETIDALETGSGDVPQVQFDGLPPEEQILVKDLKQIHVDVAKKDERYVDRLTQYPGKKAVRRLGCYACHDIPGFAHAKPS